MTGRQPSDAEALARIVHLHPHHLDGPAEPGAREAAATSPSRRRSLRQEAILTLPEMADAGGVKPSDIAATRCSVSNTYGLLQSLHRAGLVELVLGVHPQRWRFKTSHRHDDRVVFAQLAGVVRSGEWTTCGDLSVASRGDIAAAAVVCLVATRNDGLPAAHRVLLEGGEPPPHDHEHQRATSRTLAGPDGAPSRS
jgi:hypothetical protein